MGDAWILDAMRTPRGKGKNVDVNHGAMGRGPGIATIDGGA